MSDPNADSIQDAQSEDFYVIGIGVSAGGLEALRTFFDNLEAGCRHCFIIVQHLSPDHKSLMVELLAKNTDMKVSEVLDHGRIEGGHVYVIPPRMNLTISNGELHLSEKPRSRELNLPIDIFFRSLASDQCERAIGIILSGTGSDGTSGARAIKEAGGMVMVQSPDDAAFDGMPNSAIGTGLVDFIEPASRLPGELLEYLNHPDLRELLPSLQRDDSTALDSILMQVKLRADLDFSNYKRPTLLRRIERRLKTTKSRSYEEYLKYVSSNPEEADILAREFLIGVTSFFRDPHSWDVLAQEVLADLVRSKVESKEEIRIWLVGCSTGEEAYTLAILLREELERQGAVLDVKIFATDIMRSNLEIAGRGAYPESIVADVEGEYIDKYFVKRDAEYQIKNSVRRMVIFSQHNVLVDPPFNRVDLAVCRNLLIYLDSEAQRKAIGHLHYATAMNGCLFLGSSETVGGYSSVFDEVHRKARIYRNVRPAASFGAALQHLGTHSRRPTESQLWRSRAQNALTEATNELLAEEIGIASIFVDTDMQILHAVGDLRQFADLPDRGFSAQLGKIMPISISAAVSTAIRKAEKSNERIRINSVRYEHDGNTRNLDLLVTPLKLPPVNRSKSYAVILIPRETPQNRIELLPVATEFDNDQRLLDLQEELQHTREELQSTIEDGETNREELQATNEELLAANEELQSSNEELQSVNEELHTVNTEFQQKLEQISELNSEIDNLLNSTQIGILFLDRELQIRRLTPSIREQFNLEDSDIGRPLAHFTGYFAETDNAAILEIARRVMASGNPEVSEARTLDGKWYLKRTYPFRDGDGEVDGVVLSFVDISAQKTAESALHASRKRLIEAQLIAGMGDYTWDVESGEVTWSDALHDLYRCARDKPVDYESFYRDMLTDDERDDIMAWHQRCIDRRDGVLTPREYSVIRGDGSTMTVKTQGIIDYPAGRGPIVRGTVVDITDIKEKELELLGAEERQRATLEHMIDAVFVIDTKGHVQYCNSAASAMFDYGKDELFGQNISMLMPGEHRDAHDSYIAHHLETGETKVIGIGREVTGLTKSGIEIPMSLSVTKFDVGGQTLFAGILRDLTERDAYEEKLRRRNDALTEVNRELEQFAYVAAHDLQEPLRTISNYTGLLAEEYSENFDDTARKSMDFILDASERMKQLIQGLLEYSRLGRKRRISDVNCDHLLAEMTQVLSSSIQEASAEIVIGELPTIVGCEVELRLLFQNLLSNALKFRAPDQKTRIEITAQRQTGAWQFTVADNGIGIAAPMYERIFEIFQRLHASSRYEGTGIGLSQCKKVVELHGGRIWVDSTPDEGSRFHFVIPDKVDQGHDV